MHAIEHIAYQSLSIKVPSFVLDTESVTPCSCGVSNMRSATTMPGTRYKHLSWRLLASSGRAPLRWMTCRICMHVSIISAGWRVWCCEAPDGSACWFQGAGVVPPQLLGSQPQHQQNQALLRRGALQAILRPHQRPKTNSHRRNLHHHWYVLLQMLTFFSISSFFLTLIAITW